MRTIKFRAKHISTDGWVYGVGVCTLKNDKSILFGESVGGKGRGIIHTVKRETIGQFIGLLDKNKKEIFEGDIVRVKVRIDDERGGYYLDDEDDVLTVKPFNYENGSIAWFPEDAEIIGNIHDNPELLNKKSPEDL